MDIERYTLEDKHGNEVGSMTDDYKAAQQAAEENNLRLIAHKFTWSDSEMIEDYTN